MRLHHLSATAFGPFAETVEVDFEALSGSGLFLLHGPTGAGKTSVLDAVCFALYGDVPGDRGDARRLRSDLAADGVAPRVRLELTLSARRFRLTRSPQWTRPKRRGTGTTKQQASVLVEERVGGAWVALSSRLDEAGHLVQDLVGMTMSQFCQVAMLPQGRFQAFLRAGSEERHSLLQQLFSTQRFADIEKWLRERARALHRQSETRHRDTSRVVSRLLEASAADLPDGWEQDALGAHAESGELAAWADRLTVEALASTTASYAGVRVAVERDRRAATRLDEAQGVARLQERHARAVSDQEKLSAAEPDHGERVRRLRAARRAAPVAPLHRLAHGAARQRDRAGETAQAATAAAAEVLGTSTPTPDDLELAAAATRAELTRLQLLAPREAELAGLERAIATTAEQVQDLDARLGELDDLAVALPGRIRGLRCRLDAARAAVRDLVTARAAVESLVARVGAHEHLLQVTRDLETAEARCRLAVDESQTLRETWLGLREARLSGMAAEIALGLAVGDDCPVCGSPEHPHKAAPAPDAPSAADEKAARRAHEDAEVARVALEDRVRELRTIGARLQEEAGERAAQDVEDELSSVRASVTDLQAVAATEPGLFSELAEAEERQAEVAEERDARQAERARLASRLAVDEATRERIAAELTQALDGTGCGSLHTLVERRSAELECLGAASRAATRHRQAADAADEAARALTEWLDGHGFAEAAEALAAVLTQPDLERLEHEIARHEQGLAAVAAVLHDPEVREAATRPAPDLAALAEARETAEGELADARTAHQVAATRSRRLAGLRDELDATLAAWAPVRKAHAVASGLAALAEGTSPDNALRMRLSAYVLAWRLTQVVAAANDRLLRMSDQRYTLEHTGRRGTGERRGGLSLLVRDEWSGDARDPATLSGGETFVVSLALALGLADVVTGEAGGTSLDTLFVDEGFGALDADTLDGVMDTLDSLREGGRVVGVVSHVPELRTRIPTRLQIVKARMGSTLTLERTE